MHSPKKEIEMSMDSFYFDGVDLPIRAPRGIFVITEMSTGFKVMEVKLKRKLWKHFEQNLLIYFSVHLRTNRLFSSLTHTKYAARTRKNDKTKH